MNSHQYLNQHTCMELLQTAELRIGKTKQNVARHVFFL